jgi:hypothetical protein
VHPPGGAGEPVVKKKRGRPRKYGPDGSMSLALVPTSMAAAPGSAAPGASGPFSPEGAKTPSSAPSASPDGAKKRGRPKGSTNKKHVPALGNIGISPSETKFFLFRFSYFMKLKNRGGEIFKFDLLIFFLLQILPGIWTCSELLIGCSIDLR